LKCVSILRYEISRDADYGNSERSEIVAISALMPAGATRQANNAPQQRRWAFLSLTKIDGVTTGTEILLLVIVDQERWGSTGRCGAGDWRSFLMSPLCRPVRPRT
jgi:hypothetical protein